MTSSFRSIRSKCPRPPPTPPPPHPRPPPPPPPTAPPRGSLWPESTLGNQPAAARQWTASRPVPRPIEATILPSAAGGDAHTILPGNTPATDNTTATIQVASASGFPTSGPFVIQVE